LVTVFLQNPYFSETTSIYTWAVTAGKESAMKKILILILCALFSTGIAACGREGAEELNGSAENAAAAEFSFQAAETARDGGPSGAASAQASDGIDLSGRVEFSAQTVDGEPVDSGIFQDYELTMINIWGTLCKPCIEEMPDLEALYQEMREKHVNIVGFVANVLGEDGNITLNERAGDAKKILDAKGVTYTNIVFSDEITNSIYGQISGFPTTIFVNAEGKIIGGQISGAKSGEDYQKEIEVRLQDVEQKR
jgi:thiol-disulfide isomerase/thioredoxin